jgi:hypothetical protein
MPALTPERRSEAARIAALARWSTDPNKPPPRRSRPKLTPEQRSEQARRAAKALWVKTGHVHCEEYPEPTPDEYRVIWETKVLPLVKRTETGCWEFTGGTTKGYGTVNVGHSRGRTTHRISAVVHHGMDMCDSKAVVCHHCDNPPCVNPDHLFVGTHGDNIRDSIAKGRRPRPIGGRREFCARGHRMSETREPKSGGSTSCGVCRRDGARRRDARRRQAARP